jgi:hypothetical protein
MTKTIKNLQPWKITITKIIKDNNNSSILHDRKKNIENKPRSSVVKNSFSYHHPSPVVLNNSPLPEVDSPSFYTVQRKR